MTARNAHRVEDTVAQLRDLAAKGFTYKQASQALGIAYGTISRHAVDYGIPLVRGTQGRRRGNAPDTRTQQMAALYKSGKTLQQIGAQFGLTRERVRQLLTIRQGLRARDGGQHFIALANKAKREAARNDRSLARWGCNFDQYQKIRAMKKPTRAFSQQKKNADVRGIGWELNLWQWWSIWQQSGKWAERGRGSGYVMCRKNDLGPYAIGNVYIATGCENSSREHSKTSGLPRGVSLKKGKFYANRCIGGKKRYLGIYATPDLAHAAYLAGERIAA